MHRCCCHHEAYEKGYFDLEDPIGRYILEYKNPMVYQPDGSLKPASNPIRVIDLLKTYHWYWKNIPPAEKAI